MLKRYHHIVGGTFRIVDASVIGIAWLLSYWARFTGLPLVSVTKGFPALESYASLTPLVMMLWMIVLNFMRVYESRRMLRRTHEAHLLIKSHGVALLLFIALTYLFSEYKYSRGVMIYFGILGGFLLVFMRLILRNGLRQIRSRGFNLRHAVVVGEGSAVELLIQRLDKFPEIGIRVRGVVTHEDSKLEKIKGKPVLGHFRAISRVMHELKPDIVIIGLARQHYQELDSILSELKDETAQIQLIPDIHEYVTLGCEVEDFDGLPIVNLNDSPLSGWWTLVKRATDFLVALIALIVLAPLFLLIAIAIKVASPGPIFYSQERMGLDRRTFRMIKFRSMHVNAESESGAVWAQKNDSRKTRVGSFLRATSLDEIPQLWNVLLGDMSLVGPRPERPIFVDKFRTEIPNYMLRHKVKAGMTGWAQVQGWRGNTSLDRRIECDLYYIRNWSYALDWKIMFMTLWKGFINKNAY